MSNTNELNTDEQIAKLDQKLRAMNAGQNSGSQSAQTSAAPVVTNYMEYADSSEKTSAETEQNPAADTAHGTAEEPKTPESTHNEAATGQAENTAQTNAEKPSAAEKTFSVLAKLGLPVLILLTLALCGQQFLFPRDFWFSEEVRYADIYMNMLSSGNFYSLTLNGHPFAETGPLYFILIWLLDAVPSINMPQAFFGASILFAVLFTASTWLLARGLGYSAKTAFLSGLIVLSVFFLAGFTNYSRMDLLFAALLNLSYVCFFRAWQKNSAPVWLIFAFLFLCLAALTATLTAFILPLAASVLFFLWTGKYRRINSADGIIGFLLALGIIFAWFAWLYLQGNAEYISLIFEQQIFQKITPAYTHKSEPCWYYLAGLPLALFPWVFAVFFGAWGTWIKNCGKAFKARKTQNAGAWLVLLIITHLGIFSLFKDKSFAFLVTVVPFFAVLFAQSIISYSPLRSRLFFGLFSVLTVICGIFLILFEFHAYILDFLPNLWNLPKEIPAFIEVATTNTYFGLTAMGVLFLALGVLLWYGVNRRFAGGSALIYTVGVIIALQPLNFLIAPQLGTVLSTKNHAYEMAKAHTQHSAVPASYGLYPDVFTYYYNEALDPAVYSEATVADLQTVEALTDFLLSNDKVILAVSQQDFESLPYKNEAIVLDYKQWIENQFVILTLWNIAAHKPIVNQEEQDTLIDSRIIPNSANLLNQEDKAAIMDLPDNKSELAEEPELNENAAETPQDTAQTPQILPYTKNDSPIPDNAVPPADILPEQQPQTPADPAAPAVINEQPAEEPAGQTPNQTETEL